MSRFFLKIAKISLWIFIPIILISGTKFNSASSDTEFFSGEYLLHASGNLNQNLIGEVNFETMTKTTVNGVRFSILKLSLDNTDNNAKHSMQFLISKQKKLGQVSRGAYRVVKNPQGFINNFDGVFGFADIDALGEMPFFAKSGEIQINDINETKLAGTLKVKLKNANGRFIDLKGDFTATRK